MIELLGKEEIDIGWCDVDELSLVSAVNGILQEVYYKNKLVDKNFIVEAIVP